MDKRWIISQEQWQILLSQYGQETGYGIFFHKELLEKREIIENLHQMVKEGILFVEGRSLVIAREYRKLLEICTKAKTGCLLEKQEENRNFFFYLGEECVLCEPSYVWEHGFEFSIWRGEEVFSCLLEMDFFPRYQVESRGTPSKEVSFPVLEMESQELWKNHGIERMVTLLDLEKEQNIARLLVFKEEGEEYLIWEDKGSKGIWLLNEENLKKIWKEWMDNVVCGSGNTHTLPDL